MSIWDLAVEQFQETFPLSALSLEMTRLLAKIFLKKMVMLIPALRQDLLVLTKAQDIIKRTVQFYLQNELFYCWSLYSHTQSCWSSGNGRSDCVGHRYDAFSLLLVYSFSTSVF